MTSENIELHRQIQELQSQLDRYQKTNEVLKKKVSELSTGGKRSVALSKATENDYEPASARIEVASRVKSVFFENVSHEIRSSMNGIVGMTNLVLETSLTDDQRQYLEMVEASVDRLLMVINEVLDFSRIENGELELEPEDFNLKESLDHDLYVLSKVAEEKGLEFSCTVSPEVPDIINGDVSRLVQIVTNLANNAIRFTDKGDVVVNIENGGYNKSKELQLKFSISDTGCGIDPEKLELMKYYFKQDKKPHVTVPLSIGTTGLGLTVTSQLIKIMGGTIGVESEKAGTEFWFVLPFKEVAVVTDEEEKTNATLENIQEDPSFVLRGAKVLLAEDEYINRVLIETILKQLGVEVDSVESGKEAVKKACEGEYQLVLMDVQMDDVDGLEATRLIRKHERKVGGHVGIIALTAQAMPGDRGKCLQAGMDDYLPKPAQREELVEVMSRFLTSRALLVGTDSETQTNLVRTLVETGWKVTIAESYRSALYEVSLSQFDLIILDLSLTDQEGLMAVKVVRKLEEYSGQQARIVGIVEDSSSFEPEAHGLNGYIEKPMNQEIILEHIEAAR